MTEEPPEEGAAEPAEAAGPTSETPDDAASDDDGGAAVPVEEVSGIGPAYAERLGEAGVESVADLLDADLEELADSTDISEKRIGRWQDRAEDA
jgi:predicted flap endonuclease-1-like 5' DNA nuclease